ncbi:MAG: cytidine deaminase [Lachnospiraceae bacterium]|nr:cytidine deaminase [Lachnospiraceae bacterium]
MDLHRDIFQLIQSAETARAAAYTPYSHFTVGAALLCRRPESAAAITSPDSVHSAEKSLTAASVYADVLTATSDPADALTAAAVSNTTVIITGCNIENKAYGSSMCAERTAVFKALSEGFSVFSAIAIVGGPEGQAPLDYCAPCGACRQVLSEFAPPDFKVILAKSESDYKIYTLAELLPEAFSFVRTDS